MGIRGGADPPPGMGMMRIASTPAAGRWAGRTPGRIQAQRKALLLGFLCATLAVTPPDPAHAQQPSVCDDGFVLRVEVRSSGGRPVAGASVVLPARQERFVTDAEGRFSLDGVCPGSVEISVSHLSYGTTTLVREPTPGRPLVIELAPRPIALEGLTVEVETVIRELERRREAYGYKSGVFDVGDLPPEEIPADIPAYVAARTGHPLMSCGSRETFGERDCYPFRGRMRPVRAICIDGNPTRSTDGPSGLHQMVQHADIARLEFYPSEGLMKVYTKAYVLWAAERPWLLSDPVDRC